MREEAFKLKEEAMKRREEELYADAPKNQNDEGALKWREEETEAELQWRDEELRGNLVLGRGVSRAKEFEDKLYHLSKKEDSLKSLAVGCQEKTLLFERQEETLATKDEELQAKRDELQLKWEELLLQKKEIERRLLDLEDDRHVTSKESWKETIRNEKLDHKSLSRESQN